MNAENKKLKAIVIGAGVSGLHMADLLLKSGKFDVTLIEAKDRIGGRIMVNNTFADFSIDLGGEEVHGETSIHCKYVKALGAELIDEDDFDNYIEYDNKLIKGKDFKNENEIYKRILQLDVNEFVNYDINENPKSFEDFLIENNLDGGEYTHIFEALFSNEWATDLSELSVKGLSNWNDKWKYGEKNYFLRNTTNYEWLIKQYENVLGYVQLNTPIIKIIYDETNKVILTDLNQNQYNSDIVIVSVPISQLKKEKITFVPALSDIKKNAINQLHMQYAMKVLLKFKNKFWADDCGVIMGKGINLCWPTSLGGKSKNCNVLTCLITGKNAENLSKMRKEEMIEKILENFKRVYGDEVVINNFEDYFIMNWSEEEYIEGAYTFPHIDEKLETRKIVGESIDNRVYFVGEATIDLFGVISSAIKSSEIAFSEIFNKYC